MSRIEHYDYIYFFFDSDACDIPTTPSFKRNRLAIDKWLAYTAQ